MPIEKAPPPPPRIEQPSRTAQRQDAPILDMRRQFERKTPPTAEDRARARAFIEGKIEMPPAVSSLLSFPSSNQSVLWARDPPTESEKVPRAETSLLGPPLKKLFGLVSCVVPGVRVANCTKSRPFNGSSATCSEVIT